MKLGTKINLVLITVTVVVLTIAFSIIVGIESKTIREQILNDQKIVTGLLQNNIEHFYRRPAEGAIPIKEGGQPSAPDTDAIQKITDDVVKFGSFHSFVVFDQNLNIIAGTSEELEHFKEGAEIYADVRYKVLSGELSEFSVEESRGGEEVLVYLLPLGIDIEGVRRIVGGIEMTVLPDVYENKVTALKLRMLAIGIIFTAVLVTVLAFFLRREIVRPIMSYSKIAQKVADGDLNQRIEHTSDDEIGRFGDVFNTMVTNLREFDRLKSDFISVAAHQLRTPLSGVKWVLKLLIDGDLGMVTPDQMQMVKRGYETNEKMIQLVNDLLNVSRIENGKFGYDLKENNFGKLLATLIENSELATKERSIAIKIEKKFDPGVFVFDAEKLLIALQNIVDNAIKYTLPNGQVTITTEKQGDYLQVKIQDTGVGIPKDEIHKLFSKFFRATNVIHLQTDGSGLGLFIVKNIILRHGGQIWVDSVEGKGTTFTLIVPLIAELLPKEVAPGTVPGLGGSGGKSETA